MVFYSFVVYGEVYQHTGEAWTGLFCPRPAAPQGRELSNHPSPVFRD